MLKKFWNFIEYLSPIPVMILLAMWCLFGSWLVNMLFPL